MALKIWLGTTDSDPTTAANWSPSGQPTALDDVLITGANDIDGGVLSAAGDLASFVVRDYAGQMGTEASYLIVDLATSATTEVDTLGKGFLDFNASDVDVVVYGTQVQSGTVAGLHVKGSGANNHRLHGKASVRLLETLDNDIIAYSDGVTVTTDASANATNYVGPGRLIAYGGLTNIYATGKQVDYHGGTAPTLVQAEPGATINYWATQDITNVKALGGVINLKDSTVARTFATSEVRAGGEINVGINWTPTAPPTGGTYKFVAA